MSKWIISMDLGTTSTRVILFDRELQIKAMVDREIALSTPKPGWVEQDPMEILESVKASTISLFQTHQIKSEDIVSIGITNQRETTILWDKSTGEPVYPAIVWQSRQSQTICDELKTQGKDTYIYQTTGLQVDAYFSGTKIKWILDHQPHLREQAEQGNILFGTVDTWIIWNLTKGIHVTDYSNASRTLLFDLHHLRWNPQILDWLGIPEKMLPTVVNSSGVVGHTCVDWLENIPISGVAGDQQASLFGHMCFEAGQAKNTYGTGCFLLMNTGEKPVFSPHGCLTTIAWGIDGKITFALEGSVFVAGSAVQWLRDQLGIISSASDTEEMALSIPSNEGVYFVPAFVGLGTPYWDADVRGSFFGLTRGTNKNHLARATLEAIAYQAQEVFETMSKDVGLSLQSLQVDGKAIENSFLAQFQADQLQIPLTKSSFPEITALGAALLAGLAVGFWQSIDEIKRFRINQPTIYPISSKELADQQINTWRKAVQASILFKKR